MPEAIHSTSPITQGAPPVVPATQHLLLHLSPLSPWLLFVHTRIISLLLRPSIPRSFIRFQQHLSMQTPLRHDRSAPSEPLVPDEESLPAEQPIPEEEIRAEPSHDPTHI
ncbi:hypothetical protein CK203_115655 [Vitis vinifera]|uniref:Uncharacterized protein n=1 Tax=Vitis vinifera TaxID=29760 RepID=A0A438C946_VITVI|nr:hypothetical protein CK203_115655 [Vitis vinifera]